MDQLRHCFSYGSALRTASSLTLVWVSWVWRDFIFNLMLIAQTPGRHRWRRKPVLWFLLQQSRTVFLPKSDGPDGKTSGWNSLANISQMSGQMIIVDPASLTKTWLIHCGQLSAWAHEQAVISYCINAHGHTRSSHRGAFAKFCRANIPNIARPLGDSSAYQKTRCVQKNTACKLFTPFH